MPGAAVLIHSVPPLAEPENSGIHGLICELQPRRILYISSTGVYGAQSDVSGDTCATPNDEKGYARVQEEEWIASCPLSTSLILRSAAIYGPGRGIHVRMRNGKPLQDPGRIVSRIHVDDLVAILEAGIESNVTGAWPVADDSPATGAEVAAWCAKRLGMDLPDGLPATRTGGRRVDGKRIRELLGVVLRYSSYGSGIEASLREEVQNARSGGA